MREKRIKKSIDAFNTDIAAEFAQWDDVKEQDEYLDKTAKQIGWIII
jgi:hypothetical protein